MDLVGRRHESDIVRGLIDDPREQALILVGPVGCGRSSLLDEIDRAATSDGMRTILIRIPSGRDPQPGSGFAGLVGTLGGAPAENVRVEFTAHLARSEDHFPAIERLMRTIRSLDVEPLLLLLDDVDRMDPLSRTLLSHAFSRLPGTNIRAIASATGTGGRPDAVEFAGVSAAAVSGLTSDEAEDVALGLLGDGGELGTARILAAASAGNPLFLREIVAGLDYEQRRGTRPLVLPPRVEGRQADALLGALHGLSPSARRLLDRLSTAPVTPYAWLTRNDPAEEDDAQDLVDANIVRIHRASMSFRDPLMRSAVHASLDARTRRSIHRDCLDHPGTGMDAEADRAARAWHESFVNGSSETVRMLLEAASRLTSMDEVDSAVEFAERATASEHLDVRHADAGATLVEALHLRGEFTLAARYAAIFSRKAAGTTAFLTLARLRTVIHTARTGRIPEHAVDSWLAMAADDDPTGGAALTATVAALHARRWDPENAARALTRSETLAPSAGEELRSLRSGVQAFIDAACRGNDTDTTIDDARFSAARLSLMPPLTLLQTSRGLSAAGDYAHARLALATLLEHPSAGAPLWTENVHALAAHNEIRAGDFRSARTAIAAWERARLPHQRIVSDRLVLRAWLATIDGTADAAGLIEECAAVAAAEQNIAVTIHLHVIRGRAALLHGDHQDAVRAARAAEAAASGFAGPDVSRHDADLVEALVGTGRRAEALEALDAFRSRHAARPSRWGSIALARATAIAAEGDRSLDLFQDACAMFHPKEQPFEQGRTHVAHAQRLLLHGRRVDAVSAFDRAAAWFEAAGARRGITAIAPRSTTPTEHDRKAMLGLLSREERDVIEQVCLGFRNKEIATTMFVSLRTVELRLTHAYRKLGARSRSHAITLLS